MFYLYDNIRANLHVQIYLYEFKCQLIFTVENKRKLTITLNQWMPMKQFDF